MADSAIGRNALTKNLPQRIQENHVNFLQTIESSVGRQLSVKHKQQMARVARETNGGLQAVQKKFVEQISQITRLSSDEISKMMLASRQQNTVVKNNRVETIEAILESSLRAQQTRETKRADKT